MKENYINWGIWLKIYSIVKFLHWIDVCLKQIT